ncbi:zinc finger and BTB domain-containing protein 24-like isoform X2 [Zootermopsis nevadensis]|uniref:zinc finger and BTB domain-containing protein 24-like isoform X2 n=1 Tax=Zootermopsis nevadensis TaxID=136037 RepID=UPI000B8E3A69|nr:zinc finger and BTB domain-containing protein 24-like isoform X2 [Zootermopsis nevadensis]
MDEFDLYLKRCRLCASEHQLGLNLFGPEGVMLDLKCKIKMYLSINICSEDELPNQVCYQCLYRIETFHSFKLSCMESEHTLRNWHLFYGGISDKHNTSGSGDELKSEDETEVNIAPSTDQELKLTSDKNTRLTPSVSVESVAQPSTSSLSSLKLAKMVETAVNSQRSKDIQLQTTKGDEVTTSDTPDQIKQSQNLSGKVDVVAIKTGRNILRISDDDPNSDLKDQLPESDNNNEVSRILLNMSGVGTISVTKYEGMGLKQVDAKGNSRRGGGMQENQTIIVDKQLSEEYVIKSDDDDDDDDDETDGFSGFDFEETSNGSETMELTKENSGKGLEETVVVGELIPSNCVEFKHLEVDRNARVCIAEDASQNTDKLELQDSLKYVMVTVNSSGSTRFACVECNKSFAQKSYIKEHMKIHTGEKPYACTVCGRNFRNNYMLKVHMRLHTGEKNFKCEECGALFTERGALASHFRTHTGVKPFVCIFCGRKFAQNPALKRHLRIHTKEKPYMCDHCKTCFADRGTWRNHVRIHTGERPYKCTLCEKTFVQRTNLQAHIKTHTDERPFPCQICCDECCLVSSHVACKKWRILKT